MDDAKHQVLVDGQETELTYKEYQLLKMLIQNSGIVLQRTSINECPGGEIGRRTGLKILRTLKSVPVRLRPWAPFNAGVVQW